MFKFYARGKAMVFDLEAHDQGIRKFIGRRHDRTLGFPEYDENGNKFMTGGWPATETPQEVPERAEYIQACRDGDLWPADEATARACGVKFDPTLGGERAAE